MYRLNVLTFSSTRDYMNFIQSQVLLPENFVSLVSFKEGLILTYRELDTTVTI